MDVAAMMAGLATVGIATAAMPARTLPRLAPTRTGNSPKRRIAAPADAKAERAQAMDEHAREAERPGRPEQGEEGGMEHVLALADREAEHRGEAEITQAHIAREARERFAQMGEDVGRYGAGARRLGQQQAKTMPMACGSSDITNSARNETWK